MEVAMSAAFRKLQPPCVRLAKKYSIEDLNTLKRCLEELDPISFQTLQEYIVFPIRLVLNKEKNSNTVTDCVKFLDFVFGATTIISWNVFWDVLGQIMRFIILNLDTHKDSNEEMMEAICHCAVSMIMNSEEEIIFQMYSMDYRLPLAHYLYSLLALLKQEKSKSLRLTILDCIAAMLYCRDESAKTDRVKSRARDRVAAFLPGVSIAFRNVICGDDKQGHKIFVKAIISLGEIISLTLKDNSLESGNVRVTEKSASQQTKDLIPAVIRSVSWVKETASRLHIIFEDVMLIISNSHWRVQLALATCAHTILTNCACNLEICLLPLLQILCALSVDNYEQVSKYSRAALNKFSLRTDIPKSLNDILKDDMNVLSSKLISIHLTLNDQQKLSLLKTELGYLQLLGPSVNCLLYSFPQLNRLCLTLINLIKFNTSGIIFVKEDIVTMDLSTNIPELWPKKFFKYVQEDEVISRVHSICYVLGFYCDIQLLVDYFIEKVHSSEYKNESIFLISSIICGLDEKQSANHLFIKHQNLESCSKSRQFKIDVVSNILEELLAVETFETFNPDCDESTDGLESYNTDILCMCLVLEGISNCAQVLGHDFRPLLMKVLCPIMEKAGSSVSVISQSGKLALHAIALYCDYLSITNLITGNMDYLVNSITIDFCHFLQKSEMAIVLRVALEESEVDILPLFKDPINQLLTCLDCNQTKAIPIMRIFLSVIVAVKRWLPKEQVPSTKKTKPSQLDDPDIDLKSYFLERNRLKRISMSYDRDTTIDEREPSMVDDDADEKFVYDEKQEPIFHVKVVLDILERCIHYLALDDLELCVLTLHVVDNSILALRDTMDKVLPYVHKIWPPLVSRFSDDLIVTKKAFETLMVIANKCGDFVKCRTMKDVWPKLLNILKTNERTYWGKSHSSSYQLSNSYKLLFLLLTKIGKLALCLELTEKEFETLTWHCLPFVHRNQPSALQTAVRETFDDLLTIDPDSFWFHYNEAYGNVKAMIPDSTSLCAVHFNGSETAAITNYNLSI